MKTRQLLIDAVIDDLVSSIHQGDFTTLEEILGFVPEKNLINALPEEEWEKYENLQEYLVYMIDDRELKYPYSREEIDSMTDADFAEEAEKEGNVWSMDDFIIAYSQGSLPPYDCQFTRII